MPLLVMLLRGGEFTVGVSINDNESYARGGEIMICLFICLPKK